MSLQTILSVAESNKFYVYLHLRNDTNKPFYVGKGCGKRAFTKQGRNKYWNSIANKHGFTVKIIDKNLTEKQALNAEMFTISAFANNFNLVNSCYGGGGITGWKHTKETKEKQKIGILKSYTSELLEKRKKQMLFYKVAQRPEVRKKMSLVDRSYLIGEKNHNSVSIKFNEIIYPTISQMCKDQNIKLSTFKYWRKNNKLSKYGIEIL